VVFALTNPSQHKFTHLYQQYPENLLICVSVGLMKLICFNYYLFVLYVSSTVDGGGRRRTITSKTPKISLFWPKTDISSFGLLLLSGQHLAFIYINMANNLLLYILLCLLCFLYMFCLFYSCFCVFVIFTMHLILHLPYITIYGLNTPPQCEDAANQPLRDSAPFIPHYSY